MDRIWMDSVVSSFRRNTATAIFGTFHSDKRSSPHLGGFPHLDGSPLRPGPHAVPAQLLEPARTQVFTPSSLKSEASTRQVHTVAQCCCKAPGRWMQQTAAQGSNARPVQRGWRLNSAPLPIRNLPMAFQNGGPHATCTPALTIAAPAFLSQTKNRAIMPRSIAVWWQGKCLTLPYCFHMDLAAIGASSETSLQTHFLSPWPAMLPWHFTLNFCCPSAQSKLGIWCGDLLFDPTPPKHITLVIFQFLRFALFRLHPYG